MKISRRQALALAAVPVALALPQAAAATTYRVVIQGHAFHPDSLEINPGDTVIFTNTSGTHTATALDGSFDTGTLKKGDSENVTFSSAGTFDYRCRFHHSMKGTITVS